MLHNYFVTDTVPEFAAAADEMPVMRDNTYGGYIRQEQKSGLIGVYEDTGAQAVWLDGVPWESENELFEADYDGIAHFLERAFDRMPILADLGIRRVVRGAIPYTPDGPPLVGPAPGFRNVWMACGSSIGIAWGGGTGKLLADTMVHGEAEYAFRSMDPRRFGAYATHDYIVERAREDFEVRHYTPVPGYQRSAGRQHRHRADRHAPGRGPLLPRLRHHQGAQEPRLDAGTRRDGRGCVGGGSDPRPCYLVLSGPSYRHTAQPAFTSSGTASSAVRGGAGGSRRPCGGRRRGRQAPARGRRRTRATGHDA